MKKMCVGKKKKRKKKEEDPFVPGYFMDTSVVIVHATNDCTGKRASLAIFTPTLHESEQ